MSELYGVVGTKSYTNLLADPQGADVIGIPCEPGNGEIPAGTVMYRKSTGLYAPAESGQISTSYMLVVLKEDVETGSGLETVAVAPDAAAFRAGCFIDGMVFLKSKASLTDAHKAVLKLNGIVFNKKEDTATFDNSTVAITYVANNAVTPAEADVVVNAVKGSTHTVLGNTVTGFTAPAEKTFSKWNTAADGTGTDYAAAGSYTANADLKLYAVWAS